MQTAKLTIVAAILLSVGYSLYLTADTLTWFAGEAAALTLLGLRVCGGTLVGVLGAGVLWMFLRQQYERDRQRDGAFALRQYWLEPLPRRLINWLLGRPSARVVYDPNANMSHGAVIHNNVYAVEPAAGWQLQAAYMADIEKTRRVEAAIVGDGVRVLPWANVGERAGGVANAATGRMLSGFYDPKQRPVTIDQPPAPQLPPPADITPAAVVQASKPAQLVMGQTDGGELVRWDMTQNQHLRFHGSTQGSGKTNAIQTVAAAALKTGAHVVVCDRVDFKDWADFAHCAELVDTSNPAQLADVAARLLTIYHGRTRQLAKAGAKSITRYGGRMQRIVVVISEFGAQMDTARAEGIADSVEQPLVELARLAGSTGIHLVAEDQAVKGWHRMLTTNMIPVIGRMPIYAAQACGYQGRGGVVTDTFPLGTFWHEGRILHTPNMEPALRTLLADVPSPQQLVMLTPPYTGARSTVPDATGGGGESVLPLENGRNERNAGTPAEDAPGRWDDVVAAWFAAHPQALTGPALGISDLARAMCRDNEGGSEANYEAYKGRAHKLFHEFRQAIRLPNGEKLGTDITGGA